MLKATNILFGVMVLGLVLFFMTTRQAQATPQPSHVFSGTVTVGGSPAPDGLTIEARVAGTNYAFTDPTTSTLATTVGGNYGRLSAPLTQVVGDDLVESGITGAVENDALTFFVNGQQATITATVPGSSTGCPSVTFPAAGTSGLATYPFCSGSSSQLDLTAAAAPTPTPTPTTASPPPPPPPPPPPAATPVEPDVIEDLPPDEAAAIVETLPPEDAAAVLEQVSTAVAKEVIEEIAADAAADIVENLSLEKAIEVVEALDRTSKAAIAEQLEVSTLAQIVEGSSETESTEIIDDISDDKGALVVAQVTISKAVEIITEVTRAKKAAVATRLTDEKGGDIVEELVDAEAAEVVEDVTTAKAASVINEVATEKAASVLTVTSRTKAADVLQEVPKKKAGQIMQEVATPELTEIVELMTEDSLVDRLPELTIDKLTEIPQATLFAKLAGVNADNLTQETIPIAELTELNSVQVSPELAVYEVPETGERIWVKIVGSPAPIDAILAQFSQNTPGLRVNVEDIPALPDGVPALPAGQVVNEFFRVDLENAGSADVVMAHLTLYVEKTWLEANNVHKWSIQINRYNETTGQWEVFAARPLREDAQRVYYTVGLPGFSLFALSGSTTIPAVIFEVSDLSITPDRVTIGDQATIQFTVTNLSTGEADYKARLWLNETQVAIQDVTVSAGGSSLVLFNVTLAEGTYDVRVDRSTDTLVVGQPVPTPTPTPPPTATPTVRPTPTPTATPTATPPTPTPTSAPPTPTPTVVGEQPTPTPTIAPPADEAGRFPIIIVIIVAAVVIVGGGVAFFVLRRGS